MAFCSNRQAHLVKREREAKEKMRKEKGKAYVDPAEKSIEGE